MNTKLTDIQQAVYEALGEASMAWTPIPSGMFESTRCKEIGDRLIEALSLHAKPTPTEDGQEAMVYGILNSAVLLDNQGYCVSMTHAEMTKLSKKICNTLATKSIKKGEKV